MHRIPETAAMQKYSHLLLPVLQPPGEATDGLHPEVLELARAEVASAGRADFAPFEDRIRALENPSVMALEGPS